VQQIREPRLPERPAGGDDDAVAGSDQIGGGERRAEVAQQRAAA
jgi:hypothetical protein